MVLSALSVLDGAERPLNAFALSRPCTQSKPTIAQGLTMIGPLISANQRHSRSGTGLEPASLSEHGKTKVPVHF